MNGGRHASVRGRTNSKRSGIYKANGRNRLVRGANCHRNRLQVEREDVEGGMESAGRVLCIGHLCANIKASFWSLHIESSY